MNALSAVQVVALLSCGLKAGALLGDRAGARFARPVLSPSNFVKFQQVQLVRWDTLMPVLSSVAVLSSIAWLAMMRHGIDNIAFTLVALAAAASTASMMFALMGCWPINKQLMTWSAASPPPDMMSTWARWERVNDIRTVLAVLAFACVVMAFARPV